MLEGKFWTCLANLVLIVSAVWALQEFEFPKASFTNAGIFLHLILGATGIMSVLLNTKLSEDSLDIVTTFAYPCVATQMYLINGFHELAFIPLGVATYLYIKNSFHVRPDQTLWHDPQRLFYLCLTVAVVLWGAINWNPFIIGMAVWFAFFFFIVGTTGKTCCFPSQDLFMYGLAGFNVLAVFAFNPDAAGI